MTEENYWRVKDDQHSCKEPTANQLVKMYARSRMEICNLFPTKLVKSGYCDNCRAFMQGELEGLPDHYPLCPSYEEFVSEEYQDEVQLGKHGGQICFNFNNHYIHLEILIVSHMDKEHKALAVSLVPCSEADHTQLPLSEISLAVVTLHFLNRQLDVLSTTSIQIPPMTTQQRGGIPASNELNSMDERFRSIEDFQKLCNKNEKGVQRHSRNRLITVEHEYVFVEAELRILVEPVDNRGTSKYLNTSRCVFQGCSTMQDELRMKRRPKSYKLPDLTKDWQTEDESSLSSLSVLLSMMNRIESSFSISPVNNDPVSTRNGRECNSVSATNHVENLFENGFNCKSNGVDSVSTSKTNHQDNKVDNGFKCSSNGIDNVSTSDTNHSGNFVDNAYKSGRNGIDEVSTSKISSTNGKDCLTEDITNTKTSSASKSMTETSSQVARTPNIFSELIELKCGPMYEHSLYVHKFVLTDRPYFKCMFDHDMIEGRTRQIKIEVDVDVMKVFVCFLYGMKDVEDIDINGDVYLLTDLCSLAHRYVMSDLVAYSCRLMVAISDENLNLDSAYLMYSVGHTLSLSDLQYRALQYITKNHQGVPTHVKELIVRKYLGSYSDAMASLYVRLQSISVLTSKPANRVLNSWNQ